MKYDSANVWAHGHMSQRNRRSIRLQGYDYSQAGAYFVTTCTQNRECLFGHIVDGEMRLKDAGKIVADEWMKTATIRHEIELDEWVVMPNHFHGIVVIAGDPVGAHGRAPLRHIRAPLPPPDAAERMLRRPPKSLGSLVAGFKSAVTIRVNELRKTPGAKLWQRNYWEHIVRNECELNRIREYIRNNPARWETDKLFVS
ncbi:transposase [Desulfococcus sp.]|uniref:transposase n=1 Tax=Desulfococcus sp. TaxID=2025834 RepID=UPI003593A6FE